MNVTTPEAVFSASFSHFFPQHVKILGSLIIFVLKRKGKWTVVDSEKKIISSGVLQALGSTPMTSLSAGCFKAEREERKTLDNHQCLQYLSSKRLKAHIAYNWI